MTPIYLAGASAELALVEHYMARVRVAGYRVTQDWCATVRANGHGNPRDATLNQRGEWASEELGGISGAEIFWLLLPQAPSVGCWVELGVAWSRSKLIMMSGDWRSTIFSALASELFESHDDALVMLLAGQKTEGA